MPHVATITFHGNLQDFLRPAVKRVPVAYTFAETQSVKDAIEAIGVPHTEVAVILRGEDPLNFFARLNPGDELHIYPHEQSRKWPEGYCLIENPPRPYKFILDVHLGTLAKALRMLGFDTCYQKQFADAEIAQIARDQERIVLTRDIGLLKQKIIKHGYWLRSQHTTEQLQEVIVRYKLQEQFEPFMRCLRCNTVVSAVPKEDVLDKLPPKTRLYFNEFYKCIPCDKVYWKGSHYEHMQQEIAKLLQKHEPGV
ncbi:hypothetical protein H8S84_04065 [Pontibacter sp. SD6]|uniref:Twitching motility protein PilT n=2 Tax=Pontibacter cellulosilyticus TaxID=1720253 RepID=A0A923N3U9_9BACT|nr:hypothetical protein [Pontibacter cellulosilyticus]